MSVLVLAEHYDDRLSVATLSAIAAAKQIDSDVHVLVPGSGCAAVAEAASHAEGVSKVRVADDPRYEHPLAEPIADLIVSVAGDYSHIIAAATKHGKNVLPRAAALLDVTCITDISEVESPDTFQRPIYAGNAIATVQTSDSPKVVSVRSTSFDPVPAEGGRAPVEEVSPGADPELSRFVSQNLTQSDRPELGTARIVISGGRGLGSKENFKLLESIADKLGAAIGASRAAVDAGYVPNDYQVGQTGKVVAPDLYLAVGISGAIQHLAGMKDSKVIVAINKDEEAPIFQVADYGLVTDLFKALPELEAELDKG